jgi:hypothetical protein
MSLATRIESLVIRVAQEFNDVRAKAAEPGQPHHHRQVESGRGHQRTEGRRGVLGRDRRCADRATTTYSSNKIVSLLDALKTEILGGADAAYDTLVEIQQLLQNGTSGLDALLAAVNNRVRFDAAQSLTVPSNCRRAATSAQSPPSMSATPTPTSSRSLKGAGLMSLASRIAALASRVGLEVKTKIDATHPGVARAWVCFGYVGGQVVIASAHNVASVVRTAAGRYRVHFAVAMPDTTTAGRRSPAAAPTPASSAWPSCVPAPTQDRPVRRHLVATAASSFDDSSEINLVVYR